MKNRYLPFALALGLASGLALSAQTQETQPAPDQTMARRHAPDPARQVKHLTRQLGLNADQQTQLLPILTDRAQQRQAILADQSLSQQDRHSKMVSLRQDSDAKIKALLTDSQKQKYDQLQQQMRERMQQRHSSSQS